MANLRTIIFASAERALDIPKFDSKMIGHILATSFYTNKILLWWRSMAYMGGQTNNCVKPN